MNSTLLAGAICLVLAAAAGAPRIALAQDAADGAPAADAALAPVVTVAEVALTEVVARVSVSGTLVPAEEVLVNTRVNGYAIETIAVEIGDRVEAGDVLATLDESGAAAQLAQAEAELARSVAAIGQAQGQIDAARASADESAAALRRTRQLRDSGGVSRSALEQAEAAAASARASLASADNGVAVAEAQRTAAESQRDLARLTLERTTVRAPVAGVVSARAARLGEIASGGAGEPLFRIVRDGELEVAVEVVETELGGIDPGDAAAMDVAGVGEVAGTVRLIAPTVDAGSRLGTVRIRLPGEPGLRAGLSASGWIVTDRRDAVTVPATAVLTRNLESSVQVVEGGRIATRSVVAGALSPDGRREITGGLDAGERVVARAGAFFVDGDAVRPMESIPQATGDGAGLAVDAAAAVAGASAGSDAR